MIPSKKIIQFGEKTGKPLLYEESKPFLFSNVCLYLLDYNNIKEELQENFDVVIVEGLFVDPKEYEYEAQLNGVSGKMKIVRIMDVSNSRFVSLKFVPNFLN